MCVVPPYFVAFAKTAAPAGGDPPLLRVAFEDVCLEDFEFAPILGFAEIERVVTLWPI